MIPKKKSLKVALSNVSLVTTAADQWTCSNQSYLDVICHWIDKDLLEKKEHVELQTFKRSTSL